VSTVQYTSVSHCSLNFECPRLGYGFLSIILVLNNAIWVLEKCLNFCTLSLLRTLQLINNTQSEVTSQSLWSRYGRHFVGITRYNALS